MKEFGGVINFNKVDHITSDIKKLTSHIENNASIVDIRTNNFYAYQLNRTINKPIFEDKFSKKIVLLNGRIDNKNDLKAKLNIINLNIDDEELFYKSYLKWGNELGSHIIGSFVCMIFDYLKDEGIIIKDHIGSKPLYYSFLNGKLLFSNNMMAIKDSSSNAKNIDHDRVRDYLLYIHGKNGDTFYKNIKKLQRAEILSIKNRQIQTSKYFKFNTNKIAYFKSIDECSEAFEELFIKVIKEQSFGLKKIGSKLSGGIDSSAITALLAEHSEAEVISYSAIFQNLSDEDFKKTDEKEYMDSVIKKSNIKNKIVNIDANLIDPFSYIDDSEYSEVTPHANRYFEVLLLNAASEDGVNVLFDGFDGDSVLSYGYEYLNELGSSFKIIKLMNEAKKLSQNKGILKILKDHVLLPHLPNNLITKYRYFKNTDYFQKRIKILKDSDNFIDELQYNNHFGRDKVDKKNIQEMHNATLEWPIWEVAMEFSYIDSSRYKIEERYPFFDRRVMEFCLSVPGKYRLNQGVSRYYFRESMKNYLPSKNINRLTKGNISPLIVNFLKKNMVDIEEEIYSELSSDIIDQDYVRKNFIEPFKNGQNLEVGSQLIFQLIALNKWLKKFV